MSNRPSISYWETDKEGNESHVQRQMTEEEYAEWEKEIAERVANTPTPEHPIIASLRTMSDAEKKELLVALGVS